MLSSKTLLLFGNQDDYDDSREVALTSSSWRAFCKKMSKLPEVGAKEEKQGKKIGSEKGTVTDSYNQNM